MKCFVLVNRALFIAAQSWSNLGKKNQNATAIKKHGLEEREAVITTRSSAAVSSYTVNVFLQKPWENSKDVF